MSVAVPCPADVVRPPSVESVVEVLARYRERGDPAVLLAGATDLMVWIATGRAHPAAVIDLSAVRAALRGVRIENDGAVRIGAMTTFRDLGRDPLIAERLPLLGAAAREVGAIQIQNRATIGGNVAGASPAADGLTALLAYDTTVELRSVRGVRRRPLDGFNSAYRRVEREPDELITAFRVMPPRAGTEHYWRKVGTRRASSIAKVMVAATRLVEQKDGRIERLTLALGSVAPVVVRARATEEEAVGIDPGDGRSVERVIEVLQSEIHPIDDVRSTARYRRWVAANLVRRFLRDGAP